MHIDITKHNQDAYTFTLKKNHRISKCGAIEEIRARNYFIIVQLS